MIQKEKLKKYAQLHKKKHFWSGIAVALCITGIIDIARTHLWDGGVFYTALAAVIKDWGIE